MESSLKDIPCFEHLKLTPDVKWNSYISSIALQDWANVEFLNHDKNFSDNNTKYSEYYKKISSKSKKKYEAILMKYIITWKVKFFQKFQREKKTFHKPRIIFFVCECEQIIQI